LGAVLEIKGLKTYFFTDEGVVRSVDGMELTVGQGETVGLVGESGSGKSVTSLTVMGLLPKPQGRVVEGSILFEGEDLVKFSEAQMREIRGNQISMIFQEPMTSLNPVFTIGDQLVEVLRIHKSMGKNESRQRAVDLLKEVGIPRAEQIVNEYPHNLSGGMRQRVMIAIAMACSPKLLIADEPTTALDVTIQAQILDLMHKLKLENNMSILLITHDLGVVAETCDRVVVMYGGKVVEEADVETIFNAPKHPYTIGLLNSIPSMDEEVEWLESIPGNVPIPSEMPSGCKFAPRCSNAMERCKEAEPELRQIGYGHKVRCFLTEGDPDVTTVA
jgi:oligopeptide/dipeptide ABC transporter ATP-binding protein